MSGTITRSSDVDVLNQTDVLLNIGYDLTEHNVDSIKFLVTQDLVPLATLEQMKNVRDLLDLLYEEHNWTTLLPELLYTIGRHDIMKRYCNKDKRGVEADLAKNPFQHITPYRKLLHTISEELDSNAVADLKLLCSGKIQRGILQSINSGYGLFLVLEQQDDISKDNVEFLKVILMKARRKRLASIVERYQSSAGSAQPEKIDPEPPRSSGAAFHNVRGHIFKEISASVSRHVDPEPEDWLLPSLRNAGHGQIANTLNSESSYIGSEIAEDGTRVTKEQLMKELLQLTEELEKLKLNKKESMQNEYYMNSSPRGHCIIINNMNFIKKSFRKGSEVDCEALETRFSQLNFVVNIEQNLNKEEVELLVNKYRNMDHSKYDCFVFCVLSHGVKDHFFCADDQDFSIHRLMRNFSATNCPSLADKPKLFFIQACQGMDRMLAAIVDDDLDTDGDIPDMADMVLAQSTFPGHVAFRSKKEGSWFITALCDVLYQCNTDLHLTDMLIEVNRRVAEAKAEKGETFYKQCPAPVITLRKAVWFHSSAVVCQPSD